MVVGESGLGKSTFIDCFLETVRGFLKRRDRLKF